MFSVTTVLICLLVAAVAGISGFAMAFFFHRSDYAATDTSGDFGTPRGGMLAVLCGVFISLFVLSLVKELAFFPADAVTPAYIVAMTVGTIAGLAGAIRGKKCQKKR